MKRAIVMCGVVVVSAACTKDTSEWDSRFAKKATATEVTEVVDEHVEVTAADMPRVRKQCTDMIAAIARAERSGGRAAGHAIALETIENCTAFCASTATDETQTRSGTCKVAVGLLREACTEKVEDCAKLCTDTTKHGFVRNRACEIATGPTKTVASGSASGLDASRDRCLQGIIDIARTAREKGRSAALGLALTAMKSCSAFCTSPEPDELRPETCAVPTTYLREACKDNVASCPTLCADQTIDSFTRSSACAQAEAATETLRMGDKVKAQWTNGLWYSGTLTAVYSDGTADVRYDDGDRSKGLPFAKIKLVKRPLFEANTSQPAKRRTGLVEGASCAGPGWQYVCGGRCTDVKEDSANCGKCGNRCDSGYHCDGSGTCRDASGNL